MTPKENGAHADSSHQSRRIYALWSLDQGLDYSCFVCLLTAFLAACNSGFAQQLNRAQFLNWGATTYQEIDSTLKLSGGSLYAETAHRDGSQSGGVNGRAFAWPLSTQFRVLNSLVKQDPVGYTSTLRSFADQLQQDYWAPTGGYYCCSGGGDRFYDDNAHLAVALAEAHELTGDPVYLSRAISTFDFLLTGEAPGESGGSYWSVNDHSFLDSAAALQGARAALMIYQATEESAYLDHAVRRYSWARDNTQLPGGTFLEKVFLTGPKAGQAGDFDLVNFAGFGISANTRFYDVTGDTSYLQEAQRIAAASIPRYFDGATGRINDEGYWAFELVDAFVDLYVRDGNSQWLEVVVDALGWLHENKQDPAGHYGLFWGRGGPQAGLLSQWNLNEQAAVARAYLHVAWSDIPGDFNSDGAVDGQDFLSFQRGESVGLLSVWETYYGTPSTTPNPPSAIRVPEPTSFVAFICLLGVGAGLRLRRSW